MGIDERLDFDKRGGLLPVVVQDAETKDVLMLKYANEQALEKTVEIGYATFWSTSRDKLWTYGEISGSRMEVRDILVDCDLDALVYVVDKMRGACCQKDGDGNFRDSCFYRKLEGNRIVFRGG